MKPEKIAAQLLEDSLHYIEYNFAGLTGPERNIVGTPENLVALKQWIEANK